MKESKVQVTQNGGVSFLGLLTIVFVALKLTGYVNWSWLWVLSPIWIPVALFCVIMCIVGLVVFSDRG
jgi:FtsH-binding integral membrane protein